MAKILNKTISPAIRANTIKKITAEADKNKSVKIGLSTGKPFIVAVSWSNKVGLEAIKEKRAEKIIPISRNKPAKTKLITYCAKIVPLKCLSCLASAVPRLAAEKISQQKIIAKRVIIEKLPAKSEAPKLTVKRMQIAVKSLLLSALKTRSAAILGEKLLFSTCGSVIGGNCAPQEVQKTLPSRFSSPQTLHFIKIPPKLFCYIKMIT